MKSRWKRTLLLISPGILLMLVATLPDIVRGGNLIADWGTGQSLLLVLGFMTLLMGWLIDRKASADERAGKRAYRRTVAFVLLPLLMLVAVPLGLAELAARILPEPDDTALSYRQRDPRFGFSVAPNRRYRVVSQPKEFDIRVRIDHQGFRRPPGSTVRMLEQAEIVVVGDSHPFGFGIAEDQTMPRQLEQMLREKGQPVEVINAGVPGFGLGQSLLRIRELQPLRRGAVVVVFVNPINDLVNLSSAVDYHYPKPYSVLTDDRLVFHPALRDWGEGPFLFSPPFDALNKFFQLSDRRRWYHSRLWHRLQQRAGAPVVKEGVTQLVDRRSAEQLRLEDTQRIAEQPLLYASRFWPEMPGFAAERKYLKSLVHAVFAAMKYETQRNSWHLLVVVAPEAASHQSYSRRYLQKVKAASNLDIQLGWSRNAVLRALARLDIPTAAPAMQGVHDEMFLANDDHTSAAGHRAIASLVAQMILNRSWLSDLTSDPTTAKTLDRDSVPSK